MVVSALDDDVQIEINPNITFGDVDGEIVALNIESGFYLHLNSSGSYIFSLIEESAPRSLAELYKLVYQSYDVEYNLCRQEVGKFINRCLDLGLIHLAI